MSLLKDSLVPEDTDVIVVNYEKFGRQSKKLSDFTKYCLKNCDTIVLDEAHRIKSRDAATTKNIKKISRYMKHRIAMTGTPAPNLASDFYSILEFLYPKVYTSYWKFVDQWLETHNEYWGGRTIVVPGGVRPDRQDDWLKLMNVLAIQHKRSEVQPWNTTPDAEDILLPPCNEQKQMLRQLMKEYRVNGKECQGVLDRLILYRQLCNTTSFCGGNGSPKFEWIRQYILDNPSNYILVFSNSRLSLQYLAKYLTTNRISSRIIDGKVPLKERAELVKSFQNGNNHILLCQTQACKEGLTLDNADATIFLDVFPPAVDYQQAKDRMIATTEDRVKPQALYRLAIKGTYDEKFLHAVDNNVDATSIINNFKEWR